MHFEHALQPLIRKVFARDIYQELSTSATPADESQPCLPLVTVAPATPVAATTSTTWTKGKSASSERTKDTRGTLGTPADKGGDKGQQGIESDRVQPTPAQEGGKGPSAAQEVGIKSRGTGSVGMRAFLTEPHGHDEGRSTFEPLVLSWKERLIQQYKQVVGIAKS